ncbi:NAD-dependent epimerase/dehydratase family protein [Pseudomonas mosselii]|uniref:UDP-2-acetamido-2,6-beta-L-arabino-hexul-4-ose reductase n=1 Tax=Pseudomonas mosselii TaxID=78327 RepID=UPI000BB4B0C3|nr:NAD-dependent epimerase/dehydratase family protein [Pseudomonas mosselii]ATB64097.1 capsular biosynthesis protein [Pseudomonas mosselii]MBC3451299.1 SDR family oxidoreductase [Pseudomonas mosselii]MBC3457515.1 SDR family oxidoreductase [Pseudomonas mosselii]MDH1099550.1 NAD-dependent epimerase/dehydratase family protein [Pseudomonas mosselii]MEB5934071.1 NAD-dependent epimerase/dehydratase family protein [Pseudomonas mosselii]
MKVLITGANGFIGRNLVVHLAERQDVEVLSFTRDDALESLPSLVSQVECIFHLAGVNRPQDPQEFRHGNTDLTAALCAAVKSCGRKIAVVYASSSQAEQENLYGASKLAAERLLLALRDTQGSPVHIFRLPNVFGKWARPNYNSVVATFCHNIGRDLPIQINDPAACMKLVYIDDLVRQFLAIMGGEVHDAPYVNALPQYEMTVGALAEQLQAFRDSRETLVTEAVGSGLVRALHSTYLSYLPPERFAYEVPAYSDPRGMFVEMLKTRDSGQVSFFTAHPGVTRGGHYHHSKTEKFLVIKGRASFCFRHIVTGEFYELITQGDQPQIVETVPGWTHNITNIGDDEMIVVLWANEIFDREHPDTYARPVGKQA